MGDLIQFPGMNRQHSLEASHEPPGVYEAPPLPAGITDFLSPEEKAIFEQMSAVEQLAFVKIEELMAHLDDEQLARLTADNRKVKSDLVAGYSREELVELMSQSSGSDWNLRPAFYSAVAVELTLDMLAPVEPPVRPAETGLRPV